MNIGIRLINAFGILLCGVLLMKNLIELVFNIKDHNKNLLAWNIFISITCIASIIVNGYYLTT